MPITVRVSHEATDKRRGVTLDELAAFVQEAMRANVPGTAPAKIAIGWRSQIEKIEVSA